ADHDGGPGLRLAARRTGAQLRRRASLPEPRRAGARAALARAAAIAHHARQPGRDVDRRLQVQRLHARELRSASLHQGANRGVSHAHSARACAPAAAIPLGYALAVTKRLSIVAAVAANGVIGRSNGLPWHLAGDLKWFKALTLGHHMIM